MRTAGWEATSSLSAVPSFFSLYSSGIFALYFFAQFVFSQVWNKKQPNWWCLVMVNWSSLIYSMIAAPCTCIEQTYHFCFSKSYKSILHSSCGAFLFTLWEDWYLSLVIIRNIDSMFIYILLSYCLKIDISWSSQLLHIVTGFNTGRSFFDAFYFCFITFTTIGFGDIVPGIFLFFEKYCMALKLIPFPAQILPRVCIFPPFYSLSFHTNGESSVAAQSWPTKLEFAKNCLYSHIWHKLRVKINDDYLFIYMYTFISSQI